MSVFSKEEINIDFFNEIKRLKEELLKWETGQRQTSEHYNKYKLRGIQLEEQDEEIARLREELKQIKARSNSFDENDIDRIKQVGKNIFF